MAGKHIGKAMGRRGFLRLARNLALATAAPLPPPVPTLAAALPTSGGRFFSGSQLRTLRALCAHFIPGPPLDGDPGAAAAGTADYIDLFLGAFSLTRPPIFAGGPFSNRSGGVNHFSDFLRLDAIEQRIWRTRIEGSRGMAEREWNGPVVGLQAQYLSGLRSLDRSSRRFFRRDFHQLAPWQARLLTGLAFGELGEFLDLAFVHTLEGTYGAPEYGGNHDLVGWSYTHWPGDRQPRRYSPSQVSLPDASEVKAHGLGPAKTETDDGR